MKFSAHARTFQTGRPSSFQADDIFISDLLRPLRIHGLRLLQARTPMRRYEGEYRIVSRTVKASCGGTHLLKFISRVPHPLTIKHTGWVILTH